MHNFWGHHIVNFDKCIYLHDTSLYHESESSLRHREFFHPPSNQYLPPATQAIACGFVFSVGWFRRCHSFPYVASWGMCFLCLAALIWGHVSDIRGVFVGDSLLLLLCSISLPSVLICWSIPPSLDLTAVSNSLPLWVKLPWTSVDMRCHCSSANTSECAPGSQGGCLSVFIRRALTFPKWWHQLLSCRFLWSPSSRMFGIVGLRCFSHSEGGLVAVWVGTSLMGNDTEDYVVCLLSIHIRLSDVGVQLGAMFICGPCL